MSEQISMPQRPDTNDPDTWKAYWRAKGWLWRTEPEIDVERQRYLDERRRITSDIEKGIYPFKDIEPKLTRADIEWLLATHDNGRGPVAWAAERHRSRQGLDLRGANLRKINLNGLPLSCISGALNQDDRKFATDEQKEVATVHLEDSTLRRAHLEGADLYKAHLEGAYLHGAYFEYTFLRGAHLAFVP